MQSPIVTEPLLLSGVPTLHTYARGLTHPSPTVLFYHGWAGRKESGQLIAEALAGHGMRVIAPDLPRHGERSPFPDYLASDAWNQFWDLILQAVAEAAAIAEAATQLGLALPTRIGLAGSSAGGMVAAGALARFPALKAAVFMNSCPCFEWLDQLGLNAPPLTGERLARLQSADPEALIPQIAPRPLLLLHGSADTTLPVEGPRRFRQQAQPHYASHPEHLALVEYPRLNHWVTVGMVAAARDWFERYL